ncbi:unnamed protein product [Brassica rapa subsp. trilocularis]
MDMHSRLLTRTHRNTLKNENKREKVVGFHNNDNDASVPNERNRRLSGNRTDWSLATLFKSYLKNLLDEGEEESILKSWTRNGDCCIWERVKCSDAIAGHVVDLSLGRLIPVAFESETRSLNLTLLHSFTQLQSLNLSWNWFTGLSDHVQSMVTS